MQLLAPSRIKKLGADASARTAPVEFGPVDFGRPFIPEHFTQLYYTDHYAALTRQQRLRYNQIFGIRVNEQIMVAEEDFTNRMLRRLVLHPKISAQTDLRDCVAQMIEEEERHHDMYLELNRRCLPEIYDHRARYFTKLGRLDDLAFRLSTAAPHQLTFLLWFVTALEEYSIGLSRACGKHRTTETLGELEENFVRVHTEHAKDETRHVHTGLNLIDACVPSESRVKRRINVFLFTTFIRMIVAPKRAGVAVILYWLEEHPELKPRRDAMVEAVRDLKDDERFQKSLFNRSLMPQTFRHFDAHPEFRSLGRVMRGYDRRE